MQQRVQLIEGNAIDRMRIDQDLFSPPLEATALGVIQAGASSDDQDANELDVAMSERLRESLGAFEVIKVVKPIYHLAEAMIEARTPFGVCPAACLLEDAVPTPVFKFDDAEFSCLLVPQEHVCREITEELKH